MPTLLWRRSLFSTSALASVIQIPVPTSGEPSVPCIELSRMMAVAALPRMRRPVALPLMVLSWMLTTLLSVELKPTAMPVVLLLIVVLLISAEVPAPENVVTRMPAEVDPSVEATPRLLLMTLACAGSGPPIDRRLYGHDIDGSIAHCRMLARSGIITEEEAAQLVKGLDQIRDELPDYARDIRLNLASVLTPQGAPGLTEKQIASIALATAIAARNVGFARAVEDWARGRLDDTSVRRHHHQVDRQVHQVKQHATGDDPGRRQG